jgi:uncharacterized protein YceK
VKKLLLIIVVMIILSSCGEISLREQAIQRYKSNSDLVLCAIDVQGNQLEVLYDKEGTHGKILSYRQAIDLVPTHTVVVLHNDYSFGIKAGIRSTDQYVNIKEEK